MVEMIKFYRSVTPDFVSMFTVIAYKVYIIQQVAVKHWAQYSISEFSMKFLENPTKPEIGK